MGDWGCGLRAAAEDTVMKCPALPAVEGNLGACLREQSRDRGADAARTAGDERDLPCERAPYRRAHRYRATAMAPAATSSSAAATCVPRSIRVCSAVSSAAWAAVAAPPCCSRPLRRRAIFASAGALLPMPTTTARSVATAPAASARPGRDVTHARLKPAES